jgi:hypothetical protein
MKNLLHRLTLLLLSTILFQLPGHLIAQVPATERTKTAPTSTTAAKFELTWTQLPFAELEVALRNLAHSEKVYHQGGLSEEELGIQRIQVAALERRAPYQLSIRSNGGSLREFVTAASSSEVGSFSLINAGEPADLETPLPAFNLRNANWGTVIEVLANFLSTRGLQLRIAGSDTEARSVVCVLRRVDTSKEDKLAGATQFDSFPLGAYLADQSIDDIVGAIRAGWELDPKHDRDALRLKFHPPTSILLVSGPPEAIAVASKVISQLKGAFDKDSKSNLQSTKPPKSAPR